jgi:O-antigen ligase
VCILALARPAQLRSSRAALIALGFLVAWSVWTAASLAWTIAPPQTALELERDLVYIGFLGSLVLLVHGRAGAIALIAAVAAAITAVAVVALAGYLLSPGPADATQGRLLFDPVGYANGLGGLAAIALPLLIAAAVESRSVVPALASAATVPVATALYLSQSRSAWLAFAVALGFWITRAVPRPRAVDLASTALFPALAVAGAAVLHLVSPSLSGEARDRRCLLCAAILLASAGGAALLHAKRGTSAAARVDGRSSVVGLGVASALGVGAALAVIRGGVGDRQEFWHVAWRMFLAHPVAGSGSGTFAGEWLRLRSVAVSAKDAHNLYLETLGEVGIVGLSLLVGALAIPLIVGRNRRSPLEVAALAAYGAFLIHAGFEWDWELPAVTLAGLALAGAVLATEDGEQTVVSLGLRGRVVGILVCLSAAAFVGVSAMGHTYVTSAERLAVSGDPLGADAKARRAATVLPWASEPLLVRGDLRLRGGNAAEARAFYARALERDDSNWQIWLRLSIASSGRGAVEARRRAFELDPGSAHGFP